MADLIEIQKEIDKADLRKSIEIADRSKINKFLTQQPELFAPEILKLVAYYFFDPDRKPLKVGPKPKKEKIIPRNRPDRPDVLLPYET